MPASSVSGRLPNPGAAPAEPPGPRRLLGRHVAALLRATIATIALTGTGWAGAVGLNAPTPGSQVLTEQVRAELVAHAPKGLAEAQAVWLGLKLEHQPHWHTYWKNPGDSGLPTQLQWSLPDGVTAGDVAWPVPQRLPFGPLVNHGYEGTVLLAVPLTLTPAAATAASRGGLTVRLRADWLVCKDVCIPEGGDFSLTLPPATAIARDAALFERTAAALPQPWPAQRASARFEGGDLVADVSGLPPAWRGRPLHLYAETPALFDHAAPQPGRWGPDGSPADTWRVTVSLSRDRSEAPARVDAVLAPLDAPADGPRGLRLTLEPTGAWPPVPASPAPAEMPAETDRAAGAAPPTRPGPGLWLALGLALVGGLLLNLMPCVFPVLSLKVLGFAAHADRRQRLLGGWAYTAGVVVSFLALAGLLLALRAAGEQLGWGFQLQSPLAVLALALLFTLIGLNLAGVFELGAVLPSAWMTARARHPVADHFLTGVLAVAVASPCTAPFMGASVGAAVTLPPLQALAVFGTLGVGMALPYLLATAWPGAARALPRPGAWMAHFKTLMAFPMFATVVWLLWVLGLQAGVDALVGALGLLLATGFAAWSLGHPGLGPAARRGLGTLAMVTVAGCVLWAWPSFQGEGAAASAPSATAPAPAPSQWQPWSPERMAALQADGRTVFVDFTAAWCVTCQFNKRGTLSDAALLADFERAGVVLLRADWTRRDAAIAAELARLGRHGVPVYALYRPGPELPLLLPEVLSARSVREALATLGDPPPR